MACIDNVAAQDCSRVEHIIVDGASTDSTMKVVKRRAETLPHLRWISEPDSGQSQAMNKGIALARGEIIGFLNADDIYQPGVLARVLGIFSSLSEPSFVVGNCDLLLRSGKVVRHSKPAGLNYETMLAGEAPPPLNPSSYFYHKSLHERAGLYDETEHNFMDMKMLPHLLRYASVRYFDEHWGSFRLHPGCKTNQRWLSGDILATIDGLMEDHLRTLPEEEREPLLRRRALSGGIAT